MLGVAVENYLLFGIVLAGCIEQPQDSGVDQVVQIDVHRQILVNSDGDSLHQRQVVENNSIPQGFLNLTLLPARPTLGLRRRRQRCRFYFLVQVLSRHVFRYADSVRTTPVISVYLRYSTRRLQAGGASSYASRQPLSYHP